jgi:hypothetical protein
MIGILKEAKVAMVLELEVRVGVDGTVFESNEGDE